MAITNIAQRRGGHMADEPSSFTMQHLNSLDIYRKCWVWALAFKYKTLTEDNMHLQ